MSRVIQTVQQEKGSQVAQKSRKEAQGSKKKQPKRGGQRYSYPMPVTCYNQRVAGIGRKQGEKRGIKV